MKGKCSYLQIFCLYLLSGGIEYFVSMTQMQCNHHPAMSNSSAQVGKVYLSHLMPAKACQCLCPFLV